MTRLAAWNLGRGHPGIALPAVEEDVEPAFGVGSFFTLEETNRGISRVKPVAPGKAAAQKSEMGCSIFFVCSNAKEGGLVWYYG